MPEFLLVVAAGGVGAMARHELDALLSQHSTRFPVGIFLVNVIGSFVLGLVVGLHAAGDLPTRWLTIVGVGLCGGFTTFSTAAVDAARLAGARRWIAFAWQWLGMFVACVAFGLVGYWLGALGANP